jgi:hypothetical protein
MNTEDKMTDFSKYSEKCIEQLKNIIKKCENDSYMQNRLSIHLNDILPNALENECKTHIENAKRKDILEKELRSFQTLFLATNLYYFIPSNGTFYLYDNVNYKQVKEDDIIYNLLSTITYDNKALIEWKHKTKISLIKKIKGRHLFKQLIPETGTIQNILNILVPNYFLTRNEAKYFLTCIGDNILKKNCDSLYYISHSAKQNLNNLELLCNMVTGYNNILGNFVSKYNENVSFSNCRLIKMRNSISLSDKWFEILKTEGLNIVCVAAYYSNANKNGDTFLEKREELCDYALLLKHNTPQQIIERFCIEYFTLNTNENSSNPNVEYTLSWKNMEYMWKKYLYENSIPNVVSNDVLKSTITSKYQYINDSNYFPNITTKHLPVVIDFMKFWTLTMKSSIMSPGFTNEYEVDEISVLFQHFVKTNIETCISSGRITDDDILNMVRHYYPEIDIVDNKYILNTDCSLWIKSVDIDSILISAQEHFRKEVESSDDKTVVFDDIYKYYLSNKKSDFTMSKSYFEKYLEHKLKDFIVYKHVVSDKWIEEETVNSIFNNNCK